MFIWVTMKSVHFIQRKSYNSCNHQQMLFKFFSGWFQSYISSPKRQLELILAGFVAWCEELMIWIQTAKN